ncbi:hypothetical protein LC574_06900 [Nostoc sp. CHAB 5715]|nr:hypothetical protein [Nostoc sp. CHAB 5715]
MRLLYENANLHKLYFDCDRSPKSIPLFLKFQDPEFFFEDIDERVQTIQIQPYLTQRESQLLQVGEPQGRTGSPTTMFWCMVNL